jgi:hypothetical protein
VLLNAGLGVAHRFAMTTKELQANGMPTFRPINKRKLLKLQ